MVVTIGSLSNPPGPRESDRRPTASWSERSLSPVITGSVWEGMAQTSWDPGTGWWQPTVAVGIAGAILTGARPAIKRRKRGKRG